MIEFLQDIPPIIVLVATAAAMLFVVQPWWWPWFKAWRDERNRRLQFSGYDPDACEEKYGHLRKALNSNPSGVMVVGLDGKPQPVEEYHKALARLGVTDDLVLTTHPQGGARYEPEHSLGRSLIHIASYDMSMERLTLDSLRNRLQYADLTMQERRNLERLYLEMDKAVSKASDNIHRKLVRQVLTGERCQWDDCLWPDCTPGMGCKPHEPGLTPHDLADAWRNTA